MIEHLKIGRAAYFYRRKKSLSDAAVAKLFTSLRHNSPEPSKNLFRAVRVESGSTRYSAVCFSFERQPSFLDARASVWERIFGFLLIVEKDDLIAVLKSGLDLPSEFKTTYLEKLTGRRVETAIAQKAAVFEKLRLRNMSTSRLALRTKTLEANDLENAVAVSSASRFIPQAYTVRRPDGSYSATPNTGRISIQAERANLEQLISWSTNVIDALRAEQGDSAAFIKNFARQTSLVDIPTTVHPTYLAFDTGSLRDMFYGEEPSVRLVRKQGEEFVELKKAAANVVLNDLDRHFSIGHDGEDYPILNPEDGIPTGKVSIGKTRISLPGFTRTSIAEIYVEDVSGDAGAETKRKPLGRFLDQEDKFILLFSDLALAYIDGALFRDDALLAGGATFMAHLQASASLEDATSEKGRFAADQTEFEEGSVFRGVVDHVAQADDVLLCDDLGDEWADFIAVNTVSSPPTVSFYHAKHGEESLSASAFHDSVGQAIKNLGRMTLPAGAMQGKYRGWSRNYAGPGVRTSIARIIRGGTRQEIETRIESLRTAPDLVRRVFIVTSSLSRAAVATVFQNAATGTAPSAHFVQLYWLLMSYFSACTEVGVVGYVVCRQ
jgi:hypothetical protein